MHFKKNQPAKKKNIKKKKILWEKILQNTIHHNILSLRAADMPEKKKTEFQEYRKIPLYDLKQNLTVDLCCFFFIPIQFYCLFLKFCD